MKLKNSVLILVLINVVAFLMQALIPGFTEQFLLMSSEMFARPWTIITSMFLHGGFYHIFINMYILFMFGGFLEQKIGTKRFLILYFLSGIIASLGFYVFQEIIMGTTKGALGASGAIMGILGATIILVPNLKVLFFFVIPMSMRTFGIVLASIDIVLAIIDIVAPDVGDMIAIANAAHLGGLFAGLLYGQYLLKKRMSFRKKFAERDFHKPKRHKHKKSSTDAYTSSIELDQDEINEYLKNGRL